MKNKMYELLIGLGFICLVWTVIQMIFISQKMNNFFGAFIFAVLHIMSYIGFLLVFTQIEFDFVMFVYVVIIFLMHSLIHLISLSFDKNSSYIGWSFGFVVINLLIIIVWFFGFYLKIL